MQKKSSFINHIDTLRTDLDDLITYLDCSGKQSKLLRKIRKDLNNKDPFILLSASVAAQILVSDGIYENLH